MEFRVFTRRSCLTDLHSLAGDLARMRIESRRSPGFFRQIELGFRRGLTYRLYLLSSRIRAVKMRVEVRWTFIAIQQTIKVSISQLAMDERRLASLTAPQIVVSAPLPGPPDGTQWTSHGRSGFSLSRLSSDIVRPPDRSPSPIFIVH
jgi:hypothetical protein